MKFIYYASYILPAPFYAISWVGYGVAWVASWIGDTIHDNTTVRAWRVLHKLACTKMANNNLSGGTSARKDGSEDKQ